MRTKLYKILLEDKQNSAYDKLLCLKCCKSVLRCNFSTHKKNKTHINLHNEMNLMKSKIYYKNKKDEEEEEEDEEINISELNIMQKIEIEKIYNLMNSKKNNNIELEILKKFIYGYTQRYKIIKGIYEQYKRQI
jgi:hypothetical protein